MRISVTYERDEPKLANLLAKGDSVGWQALDTDAFAAASGMDYTAAAPTFPGSLPERRRPDVLEGGAVVDDFEIVRRLGRGAAGTVYLARQRSLDRHVALKITPNVGNEGRAMATLEHPHIVQVFSQALAAADDTRLLCMQYVPGATLADVLARLKELPRRQLSGAAFLAALDAAGAGQAPFNAAAVRDRQTLATASYVEAVCWIVARIADALHFAHERGVLHRDIKPANVLIDPYGRPLLADFSLSLAGARQGSFADEVFGGTLPYMAPEHLDAFNPECHVASDAVDERSDVFSLGVVLYELLMLELPFAEPAGQIRERSLTLMAEARRSPLASWRVRFPDVPYALDDALRRCLAAEPANRYQSAGQLAESLEGCRRLCQAVGELPALGPFTKAIDRAPLTALIALSFAPHVAGSFFAAAYNAFVLFPRLAPEQQSAFVSAAAIDCAVAFPLVAIAVVVLYTKTIRVWRRLDANLRPTSAQVDGARVRLAGTPTAAAVFSLFGWLSPMLAIPVGLRGVGAAMSWQELGHLAFSLSLGFLLAATYSYFIAQYAIVRIFYPRAWLDAARFISAPREELAATPRRLHWFQIAAGVLPLAGAIMIVGAGPEMFASGAYVVFRWLAVCLILLGIAGMWLSLEVGRLILKSIEALTRSPAYGVTESSGEKSPPLAPSRATPQIARPGA